MRFTSDFKKHLICLFIGSIVVSFRFCLRLFLFSIFTKKYKRKPILSQYEAHCSHWNSIVDSAGDTVTFTIVSTFNNM